MVLLESLARRRPVVIFDEIKHYKLPIFKVPSIEDLASGRFKIDTLKAVSIEDLLRRDSVNPDLNLLKKSVERKVVCVTGGGGSIGSELCRQIFLLQPTALIIIDNCEFNLYKIKKELEDFKSNRIEVHYLLLGCNNEKELIYEFLKYKVYLVFHSAAYKHVPLVELNQIYGLKNNFFSTLAICEAATKASVNSVILISSDKAVRPTNVLGASKRFAELMLQGLSQIETQTRFCIVRFGNVLGSSGSVVPLFREQISGGGPVTVTHPEVSRYFMSIREAAQLVLQAGALGTGGDVFVLDMGEPVRIVELAERMIRLSGYDIERDNMFGEHIALEYIGLRPGEKLHEQLLLGSSVTGTGHPMIMRAEEESFDFDFIEDAAHRLLRACAEMDLNDVTAILTEHVMGFSGHEPRHDYVWVKQGRVGKRVRKAVESENVTPIRPELVGPRQSTGRPTD